jgi:hypothetical protein
MHAAPSVTVDLHGSRRWTAAVCALGALAGGAAGIALLSHLDAMVPSALAAGTAAAACTGALAAWRCAPHDRGRLAWDGARWLLDGQPGQLQVMLDLGRWMLLAFRAADAPGRPRWLPVSDDRLPQALALRAAVYCRALPIQTNPSLPGRSPE